MKKLGKDDLYQHIDQFLKDKGIDIQDAKPFGRSLQKGCQALTDTINGAQAAMEKARNRMDSGIDKMREIIHKKTASRKKSEAPKSTPKRKKKSTATKKATPKSATDLSRIAKVRVAVDQCAKEINQLLNAGYLKHSSWLKARALAQETLNQFCWEPEADYLDITTDADFIQLKQIAQWSDQDIENIHRLAKAPSQCLENIKTILNTDAGYLQIDSWRKVRDLAQETLNRIHREPAMRYLDLSTEANFIQLKQIAQWSDPDIEKFHQLITTVSQCLEEIQSILNADAGYLHLDSWQQVRDTAQETLVRIDREPMGNYQDRITDADFNRLKQIAQWNDQDIKEFHQLAIAISQCLEEIKTIQNTGYYLSTYRWKRIKYQAKKTLNQSNPLENFLERIHHTDFVLLKQIAELRQIAQWSKQKEAFEEHKKTRSVTPHQKDFEKEGKLPHIPLIDRLRRQGIPDSVIRKRLQKMRLSEDHISEIFGEGK